MANITHPFGFRPSRYMDGTAWNGMTTMYAFSTSETHDTYIGDVLSFDSTNRSTGIVDPFLNGVPVLQANVAAMTTTKVRGIAVSFLPQPDFSQSATASLGLRYRVASTARYVAVVEDQAAIFEAEESGNSYTSSSSNGVNKNCDIVYAAGSTITGISGTKLDATTIVTNAALPFRLYRMTQRVDNFNFASTDTNSLLHWDVFIGNSELAQGLNGA